MATEKQTKEKKVKFPRHETRWDNCGLRVIETPKDTKKTTKK